MGYTTDFYGKFQLNKTMDEKLANYINKFSETRRMGRDVEAIKRIYPDWADNCFNGNLGEQGEYFVGGKNIAWSNEDESIIDYNRRPASQPGLWCQWIVSDDNNYIEWDGGEKFYAYCDWLQYIIDNFLTPSGYSIWGEVEFCGEDPEDRGVIDIVNGRVRCRYYNFVLEEDGEIF